MGTFITENYDKWLHFLISGTLSVWLILLPKNTNTKWIGYGFCVLIAASKELFYDFKLGYGNAEWFDFLATMILPTLALFVSLILKKK